MKLAIVYDWIDKWGGAERILLELFKRYPKADIYTLYADFDKAQWAKPYKERIHTTFLQRFYSLGFPKQYLTPLMPFAIETINLSLYDKILSLSSSFAKGVLTRPESKHVCYLFSPTRFLWHHSARFFSSSFLFQPFLSFLRQWDLVAAKRPDKILTLSQYDKALIQKYYGLNSEILHPAFNVNYWQNLKLTSPAFLVPSQFFLVVSRLEPNKNIELVLKTFKKLTKQNLVVVGQGTQLSKLKKMAGKNVYFFENLTDSQLGWLYKKAKALIMAQEEDFGFTALEAIALTTPVISYQKSGTAEILGKAGFLFSDSTVKSLITALEKYHTKSYNFANFNWQAFESKFFYKQLESAI